MIDLSSPRVCSMAQIVRSALLQVIACRSSIHSHTSTIPAMLHYAFCPSPPCSFFSDPAIPILML